MAAWLVRRFLKQIRNNIITGLFLIIPVIGSVWIILKLFAWADSALPAIIGMKWAVGMGLLVTLIIAYLTGLATKYWLGRKIIATGNSVIVSIPFLNKIYLVLKQIVDTVTADKKKIFERTVLVEFPRENCYAIGFVTSETNPAFSAKTARNLIAVFIPKAPNPTTGFLLYFPEEQLIPLDLPVESAFKMVVSAGILSMEKLGGSQSLPSISRHWNWMDIFGRKKRPHHPHDPRD